MPNASTTNSWFFPPTTAEVQFDEKWSFVGRKEKNCQPDDSRRGDCWDHTAIDPESRLIVSLVVGKRTSEATHELVADFRRRTGDRIMRLMTSDEYSAYPEAIRAAYGREIVPPRTGKPGRPAGPRIELPAELVYATVHKEREKNRVVRVDTRLVFGTLVALTLALAVSKVSRVVNTCFVERHNGTDRNRSSRKVRKTCGFSKDWDVHRAATMFSHFSSNFCWEVRTLRVRGECGSWVARTPAMAAGLTDPVWTLSEWLAYPAVQRR
jgi:IS1 family transposase